jgi:hypothetical protein
MRYRFAAVVAVAAVFTSTSVCLAETPFDPDEALEKPKAYVGSDVCRTCHLEHYDAWKRTLHSKMLQDARADADVFVTDIDEATIRADLTALAETKELKVPPSDIFIPDVADIRYTIGSQWKQRYLFDHEGDLKIAPVQFNIDTGRWVNYHEHNWDERPWLLKCGGCHATGVDLDEKTFVEPGVGCEACHGPGSHHAALPKDKTFEKRATIVNPANLTGGVATQICGSCHNRGKATKAKGAGWPVGYRPGRALEPYYNSVEPGSKYLYSNTFSKGHHQQYIDWTQSAHADSGVDCVACHVVHDLGNPMFSGKTKVQGDRLCTTCHEQTAKVGAHSVHSFGNCTNCHMPRIAKSAESGDIRSHVFKAVLPEVTVEAGIPNSCQGCHKHKDADPAKLQEKWDRLTSRKPRPAAAAAEDG